MVIHVIILCPIFRFLRREKAVDKQRYPVAHTAYIYIILFNNFLIDSKGAKNRKSHV
jgi:hypothetical protein